MQQRITGRSGVLVAVLTASAALVGCAHGAKSSDTAERVETARGQLTDGDTITATVESIDPDARLVLLRDEQGQRFAVEAGEAAIARIRPGDQIKVQYQESVAFALQDPSEGKPAEDTKVQQSTERKGSGDVQFGRQISTTVEILKVAPDGATVAFRVPEGAVRSVAIADATNQQKVKSLRPGDAVHVTYTEKLALAVDERSER
jgi:translation initiation factor IF-1